MKTTGFLKSARRDIRAFPARGRSFGALAESIVKDLYNRRRLDGGWQKLRRDGRNDTEARPLYITIIPGESPLPIAEHEC